MHALIKILLATKWHLMVMDRFDKVILYLWPWRRNDLIMKLHSSVSMLFRVLVYVCSQLYVFWPFHVISKGQKGKRKVLKAFFFLTKTSWKGLCVLDLFVGEGQLLTCYFFSPILGILTLKLVSLTFLTCFKPRLAAVDRRLLLRNN